MNIFESFKEVKQLEGMVKQAHIVSSLLMKVLFHPCQRLFLLRSSERLSITQSLSHALRRKTLGGKKGSSSRCSPKYASCRHLSERSRTSPFTSELYRRAINIIASILLMCQLQSIICSIPMVLQEEPRVVRYRGTTPDFLKYLKNETSDTLKGSSDRNP